MKQRTATRKMALTTFGLAAAILVFFAADIFSQSPKQNELVGRGGDAEGWEMMAAFEKLGLKLHRYEYHFSIPHRLKLRMEHYVDGKLVESQDEQIAEWDMNSGKHKFMILEKRESENTFSFSAVREGGRMKNLGAVDLTGGVRLDPAKMFSLARYKLSLTANTESDIFYKLKKKDGKGYRIGWGKPMETKNNFKHFVVIYITIEHK